VERLGAKQYVRGVEFGLLGPLAVWSDGRELALGGAKQRALLAVLLLRHNELVTTERLIDDLWDGRPPSTAVKSVQMHVSRLRTLLGPELVETRAGGYLLRLEPHTLDVVRFAELVDEGRRFLADGAPEEADEVLARALALWRGSALADFRYEEFARNEIGRLEELRLAALERRLEAALALGRHAEAVGELEGLVREHPLREGLRELLILALYRSGRQADALATYQDARTALVEELGLDPSPALQQLEQEILRQDPALDLAPLGGRRRRASAPAVSAVEAPLASAAESTEQRKTVTVVLCDVAASTADGDQPDAERLRGGLGRYVERARNAVERHGGHVERFVGDAVLAVFGVPVVHEDDAVRALRAAEELRAAVEELNVELDRDIGATLELRIGVATGEVVAGTEAALVTGHALTLTSRLQQAAAPGEILLGPETVALARDAATVEAVAPVETRGKQAPVTAFRLLKVSPDAPAFAHRVDVPMVGRVYEREALERAFAAVVRGGSCGLFTVLGAAGVGKSRLAHEFLTGLDAGVVEGRCLSYGEGITYFPVVEVVRRLGVTLADNEAAAGVIDGLLGGTPTTTTPEEIAWAVRKLLEAAARERPLVVLFDDLQWGESTFLDLVEHVADLSRDSPILLLCLARPELLDRRPGWSGGKPNATTALLEPLDTVESDELIDRLLGGERLDPKLVVRIRAAAEGNPLFLEEMLAMARETADAEVTVPPTIKALLAARIDQLELTERDVLERGSVEGQLFHSDIVQALAPHPAPVERELLSLVRKELVRPDRPVLPAGDAYRFRHLLIRDAAYQALPKAERAALHERFALWLESHGDELAARDAIAGYHLEQAYRYRVEVGSPDSATEALSDRAATLLTAAGRTARARSDHHAAAVLFGRATSLRPDRLDLLVDLGEALFETGALVRAAAVLDEAIRAALERGDEPIEAVARVWRAIVAGHSGQESADIETVIARAEAAEAALGGRGHEAQLATMLLIEGRHRSYRAQLRRAETLLRRARELALRVGDLYRAQQCVTSLATALCYGPTPLSAAIDELSRTADEFGPSLQRWPTLHSLLARMFASHGDLAEARERYRFAQGLASELGLGAIRRASLTMSGGEVELFGGDPAEAERQLRPGFDRLAELGETAVRSSIGARLAEAIAAQDRDEEAKDVLRAVEGMAEPDDVDPQVRLRIVQSRLLARRGELADATHTAREALAIVSVTDYVELHGKALVALGEVMRAAGATDDADAALRQALELFERKENVVQAEQTRALLAARES
jgi:DNA-binding SARP family transcriptional activator